MASFGLGTMKSIKTEPQLSPLSKFVFSLKSATVKKLSQPGMSLDIGCGGV